MTGTTGRRKTFMPAIALIALHGLPFALLAQTSGGTRIESEASIDELRELNAVEAERLAAIEQEVAVNGPLSPRLYELYFALATHYSERDDAVLAMAALEQALHIQRVAHGLFSMEQVAAIRRLAEHSVVVGDLERAIELDTQLMRIARQNLDDARSAEILSDAAERQFAIYERYLAGDLPPVFNINVDYSNGPQGSVDSNRMLGLSNLYRARRNLFTAVNVLVAAGEETDPRIVEYEIRLIGSYFTEASAQGIRPGHREDLFRRGRASYQRLLAFAARADDVNVAAQAMIGLADWHLLFQKNGSALDLYSDAYDALVQLGVTDESLTALFNPDVPVVLPAFNPNPLTRSAPNRQPGTGEYLNVKLIMSRYGRSRLRNLSISPEPREESVEDRIRRIVARSRFRPALVDGEAQHTAEFEFRYYYGDANDT